MRSTILRHTALKKQDCIGLILVLIAIRFHFKNKQLLKGSILKSLPVVTTQYLACQGNPETYFIAYKVRFYFVENKSILEDGCHIMLFINYYAISLNITF